MSHEIVQQDAGRGVPPAQSFPVDNPGVGEHIPRYSDVDEAAGNNAYRRILALLALVPVLAIVNVVCYFAIPRNVGINLLGTNFNAHALALGLTAGLAVLLIGIAMVSWARDIMEEVELVEERHPIGSDEAARSEVLGKLSTGIAETNVKRRKLLLGALGGGMGVLALPAIVMLADMGPYPTAANRKQTIEKTVWAEGVRLFNDVNEKPLKASDLEIGQLVNAQPETLFALHGTAFQVEKAKASLIIVRMDPASIQIPASRQDWQVDGILAYSKICTHVGCPISLWEQQTHHLLCPCHQSTFDLGNSGLVVFGPAARALPQLPITTDAEGYLVARSDFTVPVGPSYFERDSSRDFKEGDQ